MCKKIEIYYDRENNYYSGLIVKEVDDVVDKFYITDLLSGEDVNFFPSIEHDGVTVYKNDDGSEELLFDVGIVKTMMFTNNELDEQDLKNIEKEMQDNMVEFLADLAHKYDQLHKRLEAMFLD